MADSVHGHSRHRGHSRRLRRATQTTRDAILTWARWLGRQEAAVLVAALGILLALFSFIKIAEQLGEGELAHFDEWLLHLLRVPSHPQIPIGPAWLLEVAQDITPLGGRTMLVAVTLFAIGYLALERKYGAMWLVGVATAGGGLLSTGLKQFFGRERPDLVPHLAAVSSLSFPSGHSLLAAVLYLTLGALLARFAARRRTKVYLLTVALFATFMIGSSRVYLGVHYPTDVLAGWCVGLVWALSCWLVARYLQARGAVGKTGA